MGDTEEANTRRIIFHFKKIHPSREHRAEISWAMEGFGMNYWKRSGVAFKEMHRTRPRPQRELGAKSPPAFGSLQRTPRAWIFGTNCFVHLQCQIISSYSRKMMKTCQIYWKELLRLPWEYRPVQNSINAMIIPNPARDWSTPRVVEPPWHPVVTECCLPRLYLNSCTVLLTFPVWRMGTDPRAGNTTGRRTQESRNVYPAHYITAQNRGKTFIFIEATKPLNQLKIRTFTGSWFSPPQKLRLINSWRKFKYKTMCIFRKDCFTPWTDRHSPVTQAEAPWVKRWHSSACPRGDTDMNPSPGAQYSKVREKWVFATEHQHHL